jgi:hypothetical protein
MLSNPVYLGLARHALTLAAGALVSRGILDAGMVDTAVGAVLALGSVGWSVWTHRTPAAAPVS